MDNSLSIAIQQKIDFKTKPIGALGRLEKIAMQIALIQETDNPQLINPHILVFAADHGIAESGVSAYPQDVTWQMVLNFLNNGADINVFAKQNNMDIKVIDAGVNKNFSGLEKLIDAKIDFGTKNFLTQSAMTNLQLKKCQLKATEIINTVIDETNCNVIGFGEMGIGNTSAASIIMHCITSIAIEDCIGKGTGLNEEQLVTKKVILSNALKAHKIDYKNSDEVLQTFGGFEIAMMSYAMMQASKRKCIILVDGFISTVAYLLAFNRNSGIANNAVFCHQSDEKGHKLLLDYLQVAPILNLNMRLGEGTGCAVAYPIIKSAVNFLNEMASFESANVTNKAE
jgi:nicotinate-nucleotide--dimethylbenzimidazole phosphoribosyltransferase